MTTADAQTITELYETEYGRLLSIVRGMTQDHEAAEDLVHEVFEKAMRKWSSIPDRSNLRGWLTRVAVNHTISWLRRRKLDRELPRRLYQPTADDELRYPEDRDLVRTLARTLRPETACVVRLHYGAQLDRVEIGERMGIPPGTAASRLAKAVRVMRGRAVLAEVVP